MEHKISEPNARIDVADVLRGLAVMGIIILHSIEHFNFYSFPDTVPCEWMKFTDKAIWNGLFFVFSNKAYAVFALLFGFSFYIQDNNQQRRGKDFRLRFIWRMALLFIIGQFNAAFFTGEILTMYAMLGLILPLSCRLSDRSIAIFATLLIIQPIDWCKVICPLQSGLCSRSRSGFPLLRNCLRCTEKRHLPRNNPYESLGRATRQPDLGTGTWTYLADPCPLPLRYAWM